MRPAIRFHAIKRERFMQQCSIADSTMSPLTLVTAPSGYGKTVATLKWLESSDISESQVLWLQARQEWDGADDFWRCLHETVVGKDAVKNRTPVSIRELRAELERSLQQLEAPTLLVIDGYEAVTDSKLDIQVAALPELNANLYLLVISRRFAALDGPIVTSRTPAMEIGISDLVFSVEEIEELAALNGINDPESAASIQEATGGWAVAVQSALREMSRGGGGNAVPVTGRLAAEMIQSIADPRAVQTLLATALCDNITVEMVSGLTELSTKESSELIRDLEDLGLVSRIWYPTRIRFKCHPALAGVLRERAIEEFGEPRSTYLRRSHALGLLADDPEAALQGLCQIGDYESADRVLIWNYAALVKTGPRLLALLRTLPTEEIKGYFGLVSARYYLEASDPTVPVRLLEAWRSRMRSATRERLMNGDVEYRLATLGILMVAERLGGNGAESYRLARDLERRLVDASSRRLAGVRESLPILYAALAFTGLMNGDSDMSVRNLEQALSLAESLGHEDQRLGALYRLAFTAAVTGEYTLAEHYLARSAEISGSANDVELADLSHLYALIARSLLTSNRGEIDQDILADGEDIMNRLDHFALFLWAESSMTRVAHGNREAHLTLQRRAAITERGARLVSYQRCLLAAHTASLHMYMGDFTKAEQQLQGLPDGHPDVMLAHARLSLLMGKHSEAIQHSDRARRNRLTPRCEIEAHFITAIAKWEGEAVQEAFAALKRAVELMRATGGGGWYLSTVPYDSLVRLAEAAKAAGEVDISDEVEQLPETLRCLQFEPLTRAETHVLQALAEAESLKEAAVSLFISQNTLKSHLRSIYRKLRVSSRHEATQRGRQIGLIAQRD